MDTYNSTISFWDSIFGNVQPKYYDGENQIHKDLETAIKWLSNGSKSILDYGCGSGAMLFRGASYGNINKCLGIDISLNAVELGNATAKLNNLENVVDFICGGVETLKAIDDNSFDSIILSNIIDNIIKQDANIVINNAHRILKTNGKLLVKLNPYLTEEELKESGSKLIEDNLYIDSDAIYLWNLNTTQWKEFLEELFIVEEYKEIYFEQFNQYNRLFLLTNKENS